MLIFIFEAILHAAEEEAASGFTMREIWTHSGWIARTVIVMLVLMLIMCVYVGIERWMAFNRGRTQSVLLAQNVVSSLESGDISGALAIAQNEDYQASYLGALLRGGLTELEHSQDSFGIANAARALQKAHVEELSKLRQGFAWLATTGSTAPFVGLFGTTFGVINAFQGMATAGSGLAAISAGISEALITTGVGIGVAVLGVWLFNIFNGLLEKVDEELSSSTADFLDWADKLVHRKNQA
jgi:biopolymer transport protein ExbB/TolQ